MARANSILSPTLILFSCHTKPAVKPVVSLPPHSKITLFKLIDNLGSVTLAIPNRYDTFVQWVHWSDCRKPCAEQKYRFQSKNLPINKESGFYWNKPKDSIDRLTVIHTSYTKFRRNDTVHQLPPQIDSSTYLHMKMNIMSDPSNPPILFNTIELIHDRYFSIFAMKRSDTMYQNEVLAVTTVRGIETTFKFDQLTRNGDSLERNFIKNSIDLLRTIRIQNAP